ncbi:LysR family transcriptional regulator [Bordetella pertussis]|uniref:LysR-family transcriptional regulator n=4 Tax=Bordetella pertussis TaxID=520 RepID=Q7VX80_BORPE|nr:LysR family transcriptional regulator [Bordetella pertussis]ETH37314.1 LysR substrate-binding domain protein [Bordetella pertussis H918]ETH44733.1 LysR substrate-binding domain protein [Bordetella pertussis H939]ETH45628.1 LysR substrate-binding domain protein [Bordetella pertussis H921]ETH69573.1 LysR substrate-binding domain protein [Bordetella pertussis STO1-CHLA-0011]ETH83816.1 LysR substrate-binding domain protein [Bordetella pertussis STO1-CHOC-0017]ETH85836.1 LysR substrate-binding 
MSPLPVGLAKPKALHEPSFAQLGVFHAIMITSSVSRAARLMGMTQSAASKMLRQLEDDTGLRLFERQHQRLVPTPHAQGLQDSVEQLYGAYGVVQRQINSLADPDTGHVNVAAIPTQATTFLPQAIKRLRERYQGITVTVEILANQPIVDRVQSGQADFGLVHDITPSVSTLNEDLGLQHVVCVAPAGHRYAGLPHVAAHDLRNETFLSYGPQTNFGAMLETAFASAGVRMPVAVEVTSSAALLALIRAGVGVGLVEPAAIAPFGATGFVIKPFLPALPVRSRIVRSRLRPLTRHAELLLEAYRAVVLQARPDSFQA